MGVIYICVGNVGVPSPLVYIEILVFMVLLFSLASYNPRYVQLTHKNIFTCVFFELSTGIYTITHSYPQVINRVFNHWTLMSIYEHMLIYQHLQDIHHIQFITPLLSDTLYILYVLYILFYKLSPKKHKNRHVSITHKSALQNLYIKKDLQDTQDIQSRCPATLYKCTSKNLHTPTYTRRTLIKSLWY